MSTPLPPPDPNILPKRKGASSNSVLSNDTAISYINAQRLQDCNDTCTQS